MKTMHYRSWAPGRASYVETVTDEEVELFITDSYVQIRREDEWTYVPWSQVLVIKQTRAM